MADEMRSLQDIRATIDEVDAEIARLLERRMDLVSEVSDFKKRTNVGILDASREEKVIQNVLSHVNNKTYHPSIRRVFEHMMEASKSYQNNRIQTGTVIPLKFGLVGEKLSHSYSPKIHNLIFKLTGISGQYELVEVPKDSLSTLIQTLKQQGYSGVNVTVPYKSDIMKFISRVSEEAQHIGAINTVVLSDEVQGYNTDYKGFCMALKYNGIDPSGRRCAVLGSGGSAHAVIAGLEDRGASEIVIVSRDPDSAMFKFPGLPAIELSAFYAEGYDVVINTTPLGMYPNCEASPIAKEQVNGAGFVMDLIYNPRKTLLLSYCEELGIKHANGLFMLVAQAVAAQEIWHNKTIDQAIVLKIYEEIEKDL